MRNRIMYRKAQNSASVGLDNIQVGQPVGMRQDIIQTPTQAGESSSKSGGGNGVGAAGYAAMGSAALGMAMPFIQAGEQKRGKTTMDNAYGAAGTLTDEQFGDKSKKTTDTINAVSSKSYGSLFGGMKNGGIVYRKAQQGIGAVGPVNSYGVASKKNVTDIQEQAGKGYNLADSYSQGDSRTMVFQPTTTTPTYSPGWNTGGGVDDIVNRWGRNNGQLRTPRRGIFQKIGDKRTRKVNFLDKLLASKMHDTSTSRGANRRGYKNDVPISTAQQGVADTITDTTSESFEQPRRAARNTMFL